MHHPKSMEPFSHCISTTNSHATIITEGIKRKDIASIMEVPENTVKTYLHRGKKQLKNKLKGVGYDERKILSEGL